MTYGNSERISLGGAAIRHRIWKSTWTESNLRILLEQNLQPMMRRNFLILPRNYIHFGPKSLPSPFQNFCKDSTRNIMVSPEDRRLWILPAGYATADQKNTIGSDKFLTSLVG